MNDDERVIVLERALECQILFKRYGLSNLERGLSRYMTSVADHSIYDDEELIYHILTLYQRIAIQYFARISGNI